MPYVHQSSCCMQMIDESLLCYLVKIKKERNDAPSGFAHHENIYIELSKSFYGPLLYISITAMVDYVCEPESISEVIKVCGVFFNKKENVAELRE